MTTEISQLVFIEVQEGKAQEQIDAYNMLLPTVLAEMGCIQYDLTKVIDAPNSFVLIERWASEEALKTHDNSTHMIEADAKNTQFRAKPAKLIKLSHSMLS